jgi:hypothetical protein
MPRTVFSSIMYIAPYFFKTYWGAVHLHIGDMQEAKMSVQTYT